MLWGGRALHVHVVASREPHDMKHRSPEVLELDEKVATLHFLALNVELIVLAQKQASSTRVKVEDRFLLAGHRNEDAHSGNGVLLYVVPGLLFLAC